jgi:hypothetical protein
LPDAVLADWTGDQLQVVVVDQRRVRFTATALVSATVRNSPMRLAQAFCTLIPRPGIGRRLLPKQIVFLGELYGRNDVAAFVQRQPMSQSFEIMTDWLPPDPFRRFVAAGQTANMGLLLRN